MTLSIQHLIGILATLFVVLVLGFYSGRKVKTSNDFSVTDKKAGNILVAGTIMGTLIGGSSTVGTAQLAFLYGLSAWWFTLGGGIACFFLGLILVKPLRRENFETVPRFLKSAYGEQAAVAAALFLSIAIFLNIIPQIMSSTALLVSMFPLAANLAPLITVLLMASYVLFGGVWGTGYIGIMKVILTCLSVLIGGGLALNMMGGISGIYSSFPSYPWFSLFGRGVNTDLAAGFSLVLGVLSSQIYFQAIFSARDEKSARQGALISAVLSPVIGLMGIVIGLFMRFNHPDIEAALALPLFILRYLNPWFAGVMQATLLLAAIGTGAGLALGVSTMLSRDIYQKLHPEAGDCRVLMIFRSFILITLFLALVTLSIFGGNGLILQWSFLSLSLRGTTIFFPLIAALFIKGRVDARAGTIAVIAGPLSVFFSSLFLSWEINPLYLGMSVSFLIIFIGFLKLWQAAYSKSA